MIRKLPEASAKLVREVEEQDGGFEEGLIIASFDPFAPDDYPLYQHVGPPHQRVAISALHCQLSPEAELPACDKAQSALVDCYASLTGLLVDAVLQNQMGAAAG